MVSVDLARHKRWWTLLAVLVGLCLVALVWFVMTPKNAPTGQVDLTPSSTTTSTTAQQPSVSPAPTVSAPVLTATAIAAVETALNSGHDDDIRRVLPMTDKETGAAEFTNHMSALRLVLDASSMTVVDTGLWEVKAADASGESWDLGIVLVDDSPQLVYAERSEN